MRSFLLSLLLSAVLAISASATPTFFIHPNEQLTNPVINCPGDTTLLTDPFSCSVLYDYAVSATDDQPIASLVQTEGLPSGAPFPIGTTVNTYLATDTDGNTASCSFSVTVVDDVPPNVAVNEYTQIYIGPFDDPNDCYDGYVTSVYALSFDDGSYDNCSSNLKVTIRRAEPYSAFIQSLNPINGHPDCSDGDPDAQSEFALATGEAETIKFYCEEAGTEQFVIIRVYQLDENGNVDLDQNGNPIYTEAAAQLAAINPSVICEAPNTSAQLAGSIQLDANGDCAPDANTQGLPNMIVEAKAASGETFYTVTGTGGSYNLSNLPEGLTEVNIKPYLPIWNICNNQAAVNLPAAPSATQLDFNALPTLSCPLLTVDIAAHAITPCITNAWPVLYSNKGNVTAQNATVNIQTDGTLSIVGASKPFSIQGNIMTVQIADIKPGESGSFEVNIEVPCDAYLIGQYICVEAAIAPVSNCLPTTPEWSGAQIEASAVCEGDSIRFTLKNTGGAATTQALEFIIIDDMVVMFTGQLPAGFVPNEEIHQTVFAQGHSLRIQAKQEPGHPLAQNPSLAIDNCNGNTTNSSILQFANEDGNPFTDHECRQIVATGNSSQLQAFPVGFGANHLIAPNTRVTYQVDFQNTGNNDVQVVVIRDTIPALLNPADIHVGASSHPYTWSLSGTGVLEIRFEPIELPTAASNDAASRGFIQFDIAQRQDNPVGALIENKADVYFNIDPLFQTNSTFHTIGENFLTTGTSHLGVANTIHIYPNPAGTQTFLSLETMEPIQVRLVNMFGQTVAEYSGKTPGITLERRKLPAGLYQVEVQNAGIWQKSGKLIWE